MEKIDKKKLEEIRTHVKNVCKINEDVLEDRISEIPLIQHELFIRCIY